jgi:hypothetical protein
VITACQSQCDIGTTTPSSGASTSAPGGIPIHRRVYSGQITIATPCETGPDSCVWQGYVTLFTGNGGGDACYLTGTGSNQIYESFDGSPYPPARRLLDTVSCNLSIYSSNPPYIGTGFWNCDYSNCRNNFNQTYSDGSTADYVNYNAFSYYDRYMLSQGACNSVTANAQQQGTSWVSNTGWPNLKSQQAGAGEAPGNGPFENQQTTQGCPPVNQELTYNSYTVTVKTTVSGIFYKISDAQAKALSLLQAQLPGNYTIKQGTLKVCTPTVSGTSGNTINITCTDTGQGVYDFTSSVQSQLQSQLAGKSQLAAQAACSAFQGVASCTVSSAMPTDPNAITIKYTNYP